MIFFPNLQQSTAPALDLVSFPGIFLPAIFLALLFSSMELVPSLLVPAHARVELLQPRRPLPQALAP
jgi:hypothetical protein